MPTLSSYHSDTNSCGSKFRRWAENLSLKIRFASSRPLLRFEEGIQRTLPVAFQIERDEGKSQFFDPHGNLLRDLTCQTAREFIGCKLDPRKLAMNADAKLAEAQVTQDFFGTLNFREQAGRHGDPVWHAGGKAS